MQREEEEEEALSFVVCFFFNALHLCAVPITCEVLVFFFFENLRVGVGVEVERKCLIFGTRK